MKNFKTPRSITGILLPAFALNIACSNNNFFNIVENTHTPQIYKKFEVSFEIPKIYNNPFDFNEIEVSAIFTSPEGEQLTVPAFWYEGFVIDTIEKRIDTNELNKWMVRFTPTIEGKWTYLLNAKDKDGTVTSKAFTFEARNAEKGETGFIKIHPENNQYFYYEYSGESFFGAGLNSDVNIFSRRVAIDPNHGNWGVGSGYLPQWSESSSVGLTELNLYQGYLYQVNVVESLGIHGGKALRINTDRYYHPLEAKADVKPYGSDLTCGEMGFALGKYNQAMCFILDKMYESAEKYKIGILHTPWDAVANEAYSAGFCYAKQKDEDLIKRRIRYTLARWGYSTSYWMTEYFNEFGGVKIDTFWENIISWQRATDPYNHPIVLTTASFGDAGPDVYLKNAYRVDCHKIEPYLINQMPGVIGEFGESWLLGTKNPQTYDPKGNWVRQTHWNALVSNWAGALTWWTHPIYGEKGCNAYDEIYPALEAFLKDENIAANGPWQILNIVCNTEAFDHIRLTANKSMSKAFLWIVRTPPSEIKDREPLKDKLIRVSMPNGNNYKIEWWDSQKGEILSNDLATREGEMIKIKIPNHVTRDIAAKILRLD